LSATTRRARAACWRAVASVQPNTSAIAANGMSSASCSTNATRWGGLSRSSTTIAAMRTDSSRTTVASGPSSSGLVISGSGSHGPT
jgi:hypothetical protein